MVMQNPNFNPFNLSSDDIRLMAGEITPDEMRLIKAVLNGIKAKLHNENFYNGMTHSDSCWAWGPVHYTCAYNRVVEMSKKRPAMTTQELGALSAKHNIEYDDVVLIAKDVEKHHFIGGAR